MIVGIGYEAIEPHTPCVGELAHEPIVVLGAEGSGVPDRIYCDWCGAGYFIFPLEPVERT